jgi:transcriptional regulator with XRE-family HTH domain
VAGRKRQPSPRPSSPPPGEPDAADLNEIVAYNFRRARELRGLTQEEAAQALASFVGQRLPQASISAIERAYEGERRREFDAHEILMFACAFDLPLTWFFLPPTEDHRRFQGTSDHVNELLVLLLGREDQLEVLDERFRELGYREKTADDVLLERLTGRAITGRLEDYRNRRKELLLALLAQDADELDKAAQDLGAFFDHLRTTGIRGFVAEKLNDPDFDSQPRRRKRRRSDSTECQA